MGLYLGNADVRSITRLIVEEAIELSARGAEATALKEKLIKAPEAGADPAEQHPGGDADQEDGQERAEDLRSPLVIALLRRAGQKVEVAREIDLVAEEIIGRIERRRDELQHTDLRRTWEDGVGVGGTWLPTLVKPEDGDGW